MMPLYKYIKNTVYTAITIQLLVSFTGCSTISYSKNHTFTAINTAPRSRNYPKKASPLNQNDRLRLAKIAQSALGKPKLRIGSKTFRSDCSGTVRAIFTKAGIRLGGIIKHNSENDVKSIYRYIRKYGEIIKDTPQIGDLVFFHNTYDRSRNGRMDDALTHIGVVEKIDGTTIHFIHHLGRSIIRSRMNLALPHKTHHPQSNDRINHLLRRAQGQDRAYTAAELFAGFGRM